MNSDYFNLGLNFLNSIRIIENPILTMEGTPYEVKRTWKERLFTLPWEPLKATKTVVPQVPSTEIIYANGVMVMHPEMANKIRKQLESKYVS